MEDFKSFVYQIEQDFSLGITAKCVVHFRPHANWDGTGYGFDWMRIKDTGKFGDLKFYKEIVCQQYNRQTNAIETDVNSYNGKFLLDNKLYQKLEIDYNPLQIISKFKIPLSTPIYYCPWLSLYPLNSSSNKNTKATLRLYLDIDESPDYLEFEKNSNFNISPMKISEDLSVGEKFWKNGATVSIECIRRFNLDQRINIYSYKKDSNSGKIRKKLAGSLYVWANYRLKDVKILLIKVTSPPFQINTRPKIGAYTAKEKNDIGKYFKQALITASVDEYLPGLDLSNDSEFKRFYITLNKFDTNKQGNNYMDRYFYSKLQQELIRAGKDGNQYNGYFRIFYVGGKDVAGCAAYSNGRNIVVYDYQSQPDATMDHELLHSFNLSHSFTSKSMQNPKAEFTYIARNTENVMDYSHIDGKKCYNLWHWQWEIANNSI